MMGTFNQLEKSNRQCEYSILLYRLYHKKTRKYFKIYLTVYTLAVLSAGLTTWTLNDKLLYPAYFPVDRKTNQTWYHLTKWSQYFGFGILSALEVAYDTYPAFMIYLLNLKLKILCHRIFNIGKKGMMNPHKHLIQAIQDHKKLMEFFKLLKWFHLVSSLDLFR